MSEAAQDNGFNLSEFRVPGPPEAYYIPDFLTDEEEQYLLRKIGESPQQKWKNLANRRLQVWGGEITKNVLFQADMPSYMVSYPAIIERLRNTRAFVSSPHGAPNHVILNEYLPGQGIMPHEDGPSYHPVVATVSLGSHAIFHYYKYQNVESDVEESDSATAGRAIDPMPVLSLLLEPRSVVITGSDLYSCHLHGIESLEEDVFELRAGALQLVHGSGFATPIVNEGLLGSQTLLKDGGRLRRGTRFSLTCRDVGRVARVKTFGRKLQ